MAVLGTALSPAHLVRSALSQVPRSVLPHGIGFRIMYRRRFLDDSRRWRLSGMDRARVSPRTGRPNPALARSLRISDHRRARAPPRAHDALESHAQWNGSFVDALLPAYDYPGKEEARAKLAVTFREHLYRLPREIGMKNYMARVYGVEPSLEGIDSIPARQKDGDYKAVRRFHSRPGEDLGASSCSRGKPSPCAPRSSFRTTDSSGPTPSLNCSSPTGPKNEA